MNVEITERARRANYLRNTDYYGRRLNLIRMCPKTVLYLSWHMTLVSFPVGIPRAERME
jgi:hypothetical protein